MKAKGCGEAEQDQVLTWLFQAEDHSEGNLLVAGAIEDQPARYVRAMGIIGGARANLDRAKRKLDKLRRGGR